MRFVGVFLIVLLLLSFVGIVVYSLDGGLHGGTYYIIGYNAPSLTLAIQLEPANYKDLVVINSTLGGLYIELLPSLPSWFLNSSEPIFHITIINSSIDYIFFSNVNYSINYTFANITKSRIGSVNGMVHDLYIYLSNVSLVNINSSHTFISESSIKSLVINRADRLVFSKSFLYGAFISVSPNGRHVLLFNSSAFKYGSWWIENKSLKPIFSRPIITIYGNYNTSVEFLNSVFDCDDRIGSIYIFYTSNLTILNSSLGSIWGDIHILTGRGGTENIYAYNSVLSGTVYLTGSKVSLVNTKIGQFLSNGSFFRARNRTSLEINIGLTAYKLRIEKTRISGQNIYMFPIEMKVQDSIINGLIWELHSIVDANITHTNIFTTENVFSIGLHGMLINNSFINGNLYIIKDKDGNSILTINKSLFTDRVRNIGIYIKNTGELRVEINDSEFANPRAKISIVSYIINKKGDKIKVTLVTRDTYWGTPLGPTLVEGNNTVEKGGVHIYPINVKLDFKLTSWRMRPLGETVKPCTPKEDFKVGPGHYTWGIINGSCSCILSTGKEVNKIWLFDNKSLTISINNLKTYLYNTTPGNTTIKLSHSANLIIIKLVKITKNNPITMTTSTMPKTTIKNISSKSVTPRPIRGQGWHNTKTLGYLVLVTVLAIIVLIILRMRAGMK